jgi:hypothetical protein
MLLAGALVPAGAFAQDIEASITAEYGEEHAPIVLFGQAANVGDVVTADLVRDTGQAFFWDDPMPTYLDCPGFDAREGDISVVSRIGLPPIGEFGLGAFSEDRVPLFIGHQGGQGTDPGSAGYVQILNSEYRIADVLSSEPGPVAITWDVEAGRIEWNNEGTCGFCACREYKVFAVVELQRVVSGAAAAPELSDIGSPAALGSRLDSFPNPARHGATLSYNLPRPADVYVSIYDATGRLVRSIGQGIQSEGTHNVAWDGADHSGNKVAGGAYFWDVSVDGAKESKKFVVLR